MIVLRCDHCTKSEEWTDMSELPSRWTLVRLESYKTKEHSPLGLIEASKITLHFCRKSCLVDYLFPDTFILKDKAR